MHLSVTKGTDIPTHTHMHARTHAHTLTMERDTPEVMFKVK